METRFVSPASREYCDIKPTIFTVHKLIKKRPLVKWTAINAFFIDVAIKIAAPVSWCKTPFSLCKSNDLSLKKDVLILKTLPWIFYGFGFEGLLLIYIAYPRRFVMIDLVYVSKILVFEIESWP